MFRYISPVFEPDTVAVTAAVDVPVTAVPVCHAADVPLAPGDPFDPFLAVKVDVPPPFFSNVYMPVTNSCATPTFPK